MNESLTMAAANSMEAFSSSLATINQIEFEGCQINITTTQSIISTTDLHVDYSNYAWMQNCPVLQLDDDNMNNKKKKKPKRRRQEGR